MSKKFLIWPLAAFLLATVSPAAAQQPVKMPRVGYVAAAKGPSPYLAAFKQGLQELGHIEGQTVAIEFRSSEDRNQVAALASELIQLKVDVLVAQGPVSRVVRSIDTSVPIVFGFSGDPVEAGLVESLARPGRNMTGMSFLTVELSGKRLELLKETVPKISRVAIVANPTHPGDKSEFKETEAAAQALKTVLQYVSVTSASEFDNAFQTIIKGQAQAVLTFPDAVTVANRVRLAEFALQKRLPTIFGWREYVGAGGLMSYGPNLNDSFRRLAVFVDKVLKGTKPADLPVERAYKFEFVINLQTAKQIGLTIPPNVLVRADKVIK